MKCRISRRAQRDLEEIWAHLAQFSPAAADRVEAAIDQACRDLCRYPRSGHRRADVANPAYRFVVVYRYLIGYRVRGKTVTIVRVLHGSRDIRDVFRRG